jgi:hypothetical protein
MRIYVTVGKSLKALTGMLKVARAIGVRCNTVWSNKMMHAF